MAKRPTNDDNDEAPGRRGKVDPLIAALLSHLPAPHSVWPPPERQQWMTMLQQALAVVYKDAAPPKPAAGQPHAGSTSGTVRTP